MKFSFKRFCAKVLFTLCAVVVMVVFYPYTLLRYGIEGLIEDWKEDKESLLEFYRAADKVIK